MADNTQLNSGAGGDVIASDDIGPGVKYQRVKLTLGADGVNDGDVASGNPMPTNPSDRAARDCGKIDIANLDTLATFDLDSGAGTSNVQGIAIAVAASGGPVAITGDAANGLDVDVTRLPSIPAGTNNIGDVDVLTLPSIPAGTNNIGDVDVLTLPAIPAGNNNIGDVDIASLPADVGIADDAAVTVASTKVIMAGFMADETSTDSVNEGDGGMARMTLDRKVVVAEYAHTAGGWTPHKKISAATTNATSLKASAGQVGIIVATNTNASARFLKLYNKASAPTVGTDVPDLTFLIPGNTSGFTINCGCGFEFTTGIAYAMTTGIADNDSAAVAANEILINLGYK